MVVRTGAVYALGAGFVRTGLRYRESVMASGDRMEVRIRSRDPCKFAGCAQPVVG